MASMSFAQHSWYYNVTHRHHKTVHRYGSSRYYQEKSDPWRPGMSIDKKHEEYIEGLRRHHEYDKAGEVEEQVYGRGDHDKDNHGKHKGWTRGRHNPHRGD